jgi:hypothetical protein
MSAARTQADERNAKVRAVLLAATEPLGPSRIGELVNEKWSCFNTGPTTGKYGLSAAITPICRRIGAVGVKGKWSLKAPA